MIPREWPPNAIRGLPPLARHDVGEVVAGHWHPGAVLALAGLLAAYLVARRRGTPEAGEHAREAAFLGGTGAAALAVLGPLAAWAEQVALSAHMLQHLVLTLLVPPLWLAGTPPRLLRPLLTRPGVARVGRRLTRPPVAFLLGGATLVAWHLPPLFEAALRHEGLHALEHATLLGSALLFWWPIAGPLPEWPRPAPPARLLYLLLCTLPMTAVAAPITLSARLLYPFYATEGMAALWPLDPRADQALAGTLMWMGGMAGALIAGTVVFFRWAAEEGREEAAALPDAD